MTVTRGAEFDVIDFLQVLTDRSVTLLDASAAGVVLATPRGELRLAAASGDAGLVELCQIQNDQGPCLDCFRTGQPVTAVDLTGPAQKWPRFAAAAAGAGFRSVQALPMRLRDEVIGALTLFGNGTAPFGPAEVRRGQALADIATMGLLRDTGHDATTAEQLQAALNSRTVIEQAKGKLAEQLTIGTHQAYVLLRAYARVHRQRLTDVARDFIDSTTPEILPPPASTGSIPVVSAG